MTGPVTFASARQFVGLAKESVHGTGVDMTTTLLVDEFTPDQSFEMPKDVAWRGHMGKTSGIVQGTTKTEVDMKGPVFLDTIGHLLLNLLGDLTTTGTAPVQHAFSLLNSGSAQPPSHSFTHFQGPVADSGTRRVPGVALSELALKWSAESDLFTFEAKGTGWGMKALDEEPVSAPTTVPAFASWRAKVGLGGPIGTNQIMNVSEFELSMKRDVKPYYTLTGAQDPYIVQRGPLEATGKLVFVAKDEQPFLDYLNNTQPQLQVVLDNGGSGATLLSLQLDIAKGAYTASKYSGGNEAAEYEVDYEAVSNPTNAGASGGWSPCKVTIKNGVLTY